MYLHFLPTPADFPLPVPILADLEILISYTRLPGCHKS